MRRTGPRWPWLLLAAGALLMLLAWAAARRRLEREAWRRELTTADAWESASKDPDKLRIHHFGAIDCDDLRRWATALEGTLLLCRIDGANEKLMDRFAGADAPLAIWALALEERVNLRIEKGDRAGALRLLEGAAEGRVRHPALDRVHFPYVENWAAKRLALAFDAAGDPRQARLWAKRWARDVAVDFADDDKTCAEAVEGDRLRMAPLLPSDNPDEAELDRRVYGPTRLDIYWGAGIGAFLVVAGTFVLSGGTSWKVYWTRRGALARVCLAVLFLAGSAAQAWLFLRESGLWVSMLTVAFSFPALAFFGSFIGDPPPKSAVESVIGRRSTSSARERGMSKRKTGAAPPKLYATSVLTPPNA